MSVVETEISELKGKIVERAYRYDDVEDDEDRCGHAVAIVFTDGTELHLWVDDEGRVTGRIDDDCIPDEATA